MTANGTIDYDEAGMDGVGYWTYRVIQKEGAYAIYEVYYDDQGTVEAWTESPVAAIGETLEELRQDLEWQLEALDEPVLEESELLEELKRRAGPDGAVHRDEPS
jgi:hypothetical protein